VSLANVILNSVWALFCAGALFYHVRQETRRVDSKNWGRLCRTLAILLAAAFLFPCVSATDDSIRVEYWTATHADPLHPQRDPAKPSPDKSLATLVRLLEALESIQIAVIWVLAVALCFFGLMAVNWQGSLECVSPSRRGRSPPLSFIPA
jgi:hypothetical protein